MKIQSCRALSAAVRVSISSALVATGATAQMPDPADPIPPDPAVITGTLDNGLTYFVHENDQPENRAELRLLVNAGSILEDDDQLGLAHFVEHMAFNGTRNFEKQALVNYLESIGMQFGPHINAYTSFDETVYTLRVPMDDPEVLATGFQILEDWAQGQLFDPEEVDKERGVVIEEWRGRRGAQARMQDEQFPVMFEGSLYAERLPIGKPEILESAPPEVLQRFYADWYRPDLMAIVAVGDFDGSEIEAMIRERFSGLQNPADARPRTSAEIPIDHPSRVAIASDVEAAQSQVAVMYKQAPAPRGTVGDFRRSLVQGLYSGMLNSRLDELRLQADPPFVIGFGGQGGFVRGVDAFQLAAMVAEGGIERGLDALLTEAERAVRHGFAATEIERQKTDMMRSYERSLAEKDNQESASLANRYVQVFLQGNSYPSVETRAALAAALMPGIALAEVDEVAEAWLTEQGRVILVNSPEKEGLAVPDRGGHDRRLRRDRRQGHRALRGRCDGRRRCLATVPEGSPVVSEDVVEEVGVTVWTLENGVRVVLKPTDFKDDEILFSATSPGGNSLVSDDDYVNASLAIVVGQAGVGDFDQTALQKKLTGKVARVSPSVGSLSEGMSGSASPQDLETAFQLVYLYFSAPRKDETAFEAMKAMQLGFLGNMGATPNAVFSDTINATMSQGHPRVRSLSQTLEDLQQADLDGIYSLYQDRFADASDFTFYFVGAFELDGIRPMVEQYLGALPNLGRVENWRDVGIDPPPGVIEKIVRKGLEPQSRTRILFRGDAEYSLDESNAMSALSGILRIRLRELLREDMGGTYGVGVSGSLTYQPDEEYRFQVSFGSDPERADELAAVVFEEIERLKAEGPSAENVAKVRETQRRSKETNLEQNRYWLGRLASFELRGRDFRDIPSYDLIESWTAEQVQQAAIRYLRTDQYAKFVLLPDQKVP